MTNESHRQTATEAPQVARRRSVSVRPSISTRTGDTRGVLFQQVDTPSVPAKDTPTSRSRSSSNQRKVYHSASFPSSRTTLDKIKMARHQRVSSRQLLEAKLPEFLRRNLPVSASDPEVAACNGDAEPVKGKITSGSPTAWYSSTPHRERNDRRMLEQRLAIKNMIVIFCSELFGTFTFLFFALAINTTCSHVKEHDHMALGGFAKPIDLQALQVSSLGFGFALAISAWVFFRISGGVQNPAITLALTLTGALTWPKFVVLSVAQYIAGIAAAALVSGLYPYVVDSRTTLGQGTSVGQGFWLEFFMSSQLIFTVLMLAAEKHKGTYLAPVGIGLSLFITQLLGQPYTGASVNPARTFGPDVIERTFSSYSWIYYVSSYLAAVVMSFFFLALKWVRYETAAPDQDADVDGKHYQLIVDMDGNVIARMDTVRADEYLSGTESSGGKDHHESIAKKEKNADADDSDTLSPVTMSTANDQSHMWQEIMIKPTPE